MSPIPTSRPATIFELDANSLYASALSSALPLRNFQWLSRDAIQNLKTQLNKTKGIEFTANMKYSLFLEVDILIPPEIHKSQESYPPFPFTHSPFEDSFSPYQKKVRKKHNITSHPKKLYSCFNPVKKYTLHILQLKAYLQMDCILTNIRRGVSFEAKNYIAIYVNYMMDLRRHASNDFEKTLYKFLSNVIFSF